MSKTHKLRKSGAQLRRKFWEDTLRVRMIVHRSTLSLRTWPKHQSLSKRFGRSKFTRYQRHFKVILRISCSQMGQKLTQSCKKAIIRNALRFSKCLLSRNNPRLHLPHKKRLWLRSQTLRSNHSL